MRTKIVAIAVLILSSLAASATLLPERLTCEYLENPLGIDSKLPRFSWTFSSGSRDQRQTAYEIIVSDNPGDVQAGRGNSWTSGKINSRQNIQIEYAGTPLKSFTRYFWSIKVYDQNGETGAWSSPAWFETAMLDGTDWKASWIGDGSKQPEKDEDYYKTDRMPLFRKEFAINKKVISARLYISGMGYYEAYLNGKKIGDHVLDPGWTTYRKQVLYAVYDITDMTAAGTNVAGIMLGSGWWNPLPFKIFGRWDLRTFQQTDRPCVKAEIHLRYADGTESVMLTDDSWQTAPGPVTRNNVYLGESYDARLEQMNWNSLNPKKTDWKNSTMVTGPTGKLTAQLQPPIKITRLVKSVKVIAYRADTFIVDMGQNFAGVAQLKVKGPAGKKITLRYGEGLFENGSLNVMTTVATQIKKGGIKGGPGAPLTAWQEDTYTLKGKGVETWAPRFTFHGFRYVEVVGWPGKPTVDDIAGLRMNSDLPVNGTFTCSNQMFNQLHETIQWTFLSNVFSVQSDCPGREKMGVRC